jgi:NAD(P)-dependent dehydrogenase (short-subunit alcohol dehydrogenase family)
MNLGLAEKIIVVTGGSSGIGLACVKLFLDEGAKVALCGRDASKFTLQHENLLSFTCDVTQETAVQAFAQAVEARFGACDALITNAGQGRVSTFENTLDAAWNEELNLKFYSQIYPIRAFKPLLLKSQQAAIVAVNSLLALQPEKHMVATAAARAGVQNLIKSLASEFAPYIRVNSILLGLIDSNQWQKRFAAREDKNQTRENWTAALAQEKHIPLKRLGEPQEAAKAIAFLASPASSYITGAKLEVSGGLSRSI